MKLAEPIIKHFEDNVESLEAFKQKTLNTKNNKIKNTIIDFPIVYIHVWKTKKRL